MHKVNETVQDDVDRGQDIAEQHTETRVVKCHPLVAFQLKVRIIIGGILVVDGERMNMNRATALILLHGNVTRSGHCFFEKDCSCLSPFGGVRDPSGVHHGLLWTQKTLAEQSEFQTAFRLLTKTKENGTHTSSRMYA